MKSSFLKSYLLDFITLFEKENKESKNQMELQDKVDSEGLLKKLDDLNNKIQKNYFFLLPFLGSGVTRSIRFKIL